MGTSSPVGSRVGMAGKDWQAQDLMGKVSQVWRATKGPHGQGLRR